MERNLKQDLIKVIVESGIKKPSILLNGEFLGYQGKRVYLEITNDGSNLKYIVMQTEGNLPGEKQIKDKEINSNYTRSIQRQLTSPVFCGFNLGRPQDINEARITMNTDYEFICIESELYIASVALSEIDDRCSFKVGGTLLNVEQTTLLRQLFLKRALVNYRNLIYNNGASKFLHRLTRSNKFYRIRPESFVPIFVDVKGIFNPLKDKQLGIENTLMYRKAREKNRFIDAGSISAYFLTHLEICAAFDMEHFVRFKPSIWYNIYVGLLQPDNTDFPNSNRKVVRWTGENAPSLGLRREYTQEEFAEEIKKNGEKYKTEWDSYAEINSLDSFILREYTNIRGIGPTFIDRRDNITRAKLCEFYNEANLKFITGGGIA